MGKAATTKSPANARAREIPPNAAKTLAALREMGYGSFDAVMDLIDNSIDAKATKIVVQVKDLGKGKDRPPGVTIAIYDDGKGMDEETLAEALRLGSDTKHEETKDLGKYGMGLVTASISVARRVTILTREEGKQAFEADFNLDTIAAVNKFLIHIGPARATSTAVVDQIGQRGTLVRLENIDRISDTNVARFAANLRQRLAQVYRHFLKNGLVLSVNDKRVRPSDPLMRDHPETVVVLETELDLGGGLKAALVAVELPDLGQQAELQAGILPSNGGIYVIRNGREIMEAQTFGFYKHHHTYSHFRAELSFSGALDSLFHVDVKKASIHPDDKLRDKLQKALEKHWIASGRKGRDRAEEKPIKLSHVDTSARLNAVLAGAVPTTPALAAAASAPVVEVSDKPKRGRPSKANLEARAAAEAAAAAKSPGPVPASPTVEFAATDTGDDGRFFQAEKKKDGGITILYNAKHPFVRMVAEAKDKRVSGILDYVSFALARAEQDHPEGRKLVNKACDYLKLVAGTTTGEVAR